MEKAKMSVQKRPFFQRRIWRLSLLSGVLYLLAANSIYAQVNLASPTLQHRSPSIAYIVSDPVCVSCPRSANAAEEVVVKVKLKYDGPEQVRAVVDWGDGSKQTVGGWFTGEGVSSLGHRYKKEGTYTIQVRSWTPSGLRSNQPLRHRIEISPRRNLNNSLGMEFVRIPAGTFMMGSPASEAYRRYDERQFQVTLTEAFYMQTTEVTQVQWQAVMGSNPSHFKGPNLPVEKVNWDDVQAYIRKLNARSEGVYRLPTEAEWEYACRAGTSTPFGIGNGVDLDSSQANFDGNSPYGKGKQDVYRYKTTPVKSFAPNAWGLYDMHGNVREWVQDYWYGDYPTGSVSNPRRADSGVHRVARGGSWGTNASEARCADRHPRLPGSRGSDIGFRLVRVR